MNKRDLKNHRDSVWQVLNTPFWLEDGGKGPELRDVKASRGWEWPVTYNKQENHGTTLTIANKQSEQGMQSPSESPEKKNAFCQHIGFSVVRFVSDLRPRKF